jgi:hypothetical protein
MQSTERPSVARVFDAIVRGQDHYGADRVVLRQILQQAPEVLGMAQELRQWLIRTVRFLADRIGIDQFLDLGYGFPASENINQIVQHYNPGAHVVYTDDIVGYDVTQPYEALSAPELTHRLDLNRPVGLIMCALVHHIEDLRQAQDIVRAYVDQLAPGSYLVLAHQFDPAGDSEPCAVAHSREEQFHGTGLDTLYRTREEISSLFEGLELVEPGLTYPHDWWPDGPRNTPLTNANFTTLGGVARKRS